MKKFVKAVLVISICLVPFASAFGAKSEDGKKVVARAGKYVLTAEALNQRIEALPPQFKKMVQTNPQYKQGIIDRWLQVSLLAQEAKAKKLDTNKAVSEKISDLVNTVLAQEYVNKYVFTKIKVSDEEMKSFFNKHKSDYQEPEMLKARHILVKVAQDAEPEAAKKAEAKILSLKQKIDSGEDFARVAKNSSEDSGTKENGGDLGFFSRGQMVPEFEKAAFSLNNGQVSDIVKTQYGYHLIKAEERKDPKTKSYDQVKEGIKTKLAEEKKEKEISNLLNNLRKKYGVAVNLPAPGGS